VKRRAAPLPAGSQPPPWLVTYQGDWTRKGLSEWLDARADWRERASIPLPRLSSIQRAAIRSLGIDVAAADLGGGAPPHISISTETEQMT